MPRRTERPGRRVQPRNLRPVRHDIHGRVAVYGTNRCADTRRTRLHLERLGVPYEYINIEQQRPAEVWVVGENQGQRRTPTLDVDGEVLSVPRDEQLDRALQQHGILPS